jgi:hypothetical protein
MSTPHIVHCWTCNEYFMFLLGVVEKCPRCGEKYGLLGQIGMGIKKHPRRKREIRSA